IRRRQKIVHFPPLGRYVESDGVAMVQCVDGSGQTAGTRGRVRRYANCGSRTQRGERDNGRGDQYSEEFHRHGSLLGQLTQRPSFDLVFTRNSQWMSTLFYFSFFTSFEFSGGRGCASARRGDGPSPKPQDNHPQRGKAATDTPLTPISRIFTNSKLVPIRALRVKRFAQLSQALMDSSSNEH